MTGGRKDDGEQSTQSGSRLDNFPFTFETYLEGSANIEADVCRATWVVLFPVRVRLTVP